MLQDARYAARVLRRSPVFAAVAVLTLALGMGANTAMFSVVNALLVRPLPYREPGRLAAIWLSWPQKGFPHIGLFRALLLEFRDHNRSFASLAAFVNHRATLTGSGEPQQIRVTHVTSEFFPVLSVAPLMGRTISASDEQAGAGEVAVLSYGFWKRRWGGERDVLGRKVLLDGVAHTVIGVMPESFRFTLEPELVAFSFEPVEAWLPLRFKPGDRESYGSADTSALGRLRPGVSLAQAQQDIQALKRALEQRLGADLGMGVRVESLEEDTTGDIRPRLMVLLGAVGFVLLIACGNLANLMLARAASREREIAVRLAVGAGRFRLVRQLLTESALLSLAGAAVGVGVAAVLIPAIVRLSPADLVRARQISIDGNVLTFTAALALLTVAAFGLAPALRLARANVQTTLRGTARSLAGGGGRLRGALVVSEIGLATVLLIGAALMVESLARLYSVDAGFDRQSLLTAKVPLEGPQYLDEAPRRAFFGRLMERVRAIPGVREAGMVNNLPFTDGSEGFFLIEGRPRPKLQDTPLATRWAASPGYQRALGMPLLRGRWFTEADRSGATRVVVIDEQAARRYWPNQDPLGQRISWGTLRDKHEWATIVGVVGSIRQYALDMAMRPGIYMPMAQETPGQAGVVVRAARDPKSLASAVRVAVHAADPEVPVEKLRTMEEAVDETLAQRRFQMRLLGMFACLAVLLAVIGIYGVMAYTVNQRTHEIGLRVALGAEPRRVLALVLRNGMALACGGIALGLSGAAAVTRVMRGVLYGVSPTDGATFAVVAAVLAAVALLACYVPAQRAARVDPMEALRYE